MQHATHFRSPRGRLEILRRRKKKPKKGLPAYESLPAAISIVVKITKSHHIMNVTCSNMELTAVNPFSRLYALCFLFYLRFEHFPGKKYSLLTSN